MYFSIILIALLWSKITSATVGLAWQFPNSSRLRAGLKDITFPFDMSKAPHKDGLYFAQQFFFEDYKENGYTGLQPRPDDGAGSVIHAVFSSFIEGTTTTSSSCHDGADFGPGVSCAVDFAGDYSHKYNCVVETTDGGLTWRGTVVDTVTGTSFTIGEWTLPERKTSIRPWGNGFVEYYMYPPSSVGNESCEILPMNGISFFSPSSSTCGANQGTLSEPYEYGVCEGKSAFSTHSIVDGFFVESGF